MQLTCKQGACETNNESAYVLFKDFSGDLFVTAQFFGLIVGVGLSLGTAFAQSNGLGDLSFIKRLKLAKAGDDVAALTVAKDYENGGNDARKDAVEAAKWYRASALAGNLEAQFLLSKLIATNAAALKINVQDGLTLLQSAADKGYAPAQNEMGLRFQKGVGVVTSSTEASKWFQRASDQNFVSAQVNLGLLLVKGDGVPQDFAKAFSLFEKAANAGDNWGLNNLGSMYEMGWGVSKDIGKAKRLYLDAAAKGNSMAPLNLSRLGAVQ
jgi:uncharacterized protein